MLGDLPIRALKRPLASRDNNLETAAPYFVVAIKTPSQSGGGGFAVNARTRVS